MDAAEAAAIRHDRREVKAALAGQGVDLASFATAMTGWHLLRYVVTCYAAVAGGIFLLQSGWIVTGILVWGIAQHAMLNVVHEASHYSLVRKRKLNDILGDVLFAVPIGLTVQRYRVVHEEHHKQLATDGDPSGFLISPNVPNGRMIRNLLFLLAGRAVFDMLAGLRNRKAGTRTTSADRDRLWKLLAFHVPLFGALLYLGYWPLHLIWVATAATVSPFLDGLRTIAEHRVEEHAHAHTRSHHKSTLVSAIFAPFFQYHWEHHLFPSIPHCRLAKFHRLLIDIGVHAARPVRGGFFGALLAGLRK